MYVKNSCECLYVKNSCEYLSSTLVSWSVLLALFLSLSCLSVQLVSEPLCPSCTLLCLSVRLACDSCEFVCLAMLVLYSVTLRSVLELCYLGTLALCFLGGVHWFKVTNRFYQLD